MSLFSFETWPTGRRIDQTQKPVVMVACVQNVLGHLWASEALLQVLRVLG